MCFRWHSIGRHTHLVAKMFDASDKVAIVTGGAQGLGKEFCKRLLQKGAKVSIADINEPLALETVKEFRESFGNGNIIFAKCDVTDERSWEQAWNETESQLGKVTVLVNNAGVNFTVGWKRGLDIMLTGTAIGVDMAINRMGKTKGGSGGRIINIASLAGFAVFPMKLQECMGYTMAKWGVVGLTKNFAAAKPNLDKTEGLRCYALCPCYVKTNLVGEENFERVERGMHMRIMEISEIGDVFDIALKRDVTGACWVKLPDLPIMDYPGFGPALTAVHLVAGKLLNLIQVKIDVINPYLLFALITLAIFFLFWILTLIF